MYSQSNNLNSIKLLYQKNVTFLQIYILNVFRGRLKKPFGFGKYTQTVVYSNRK